MEIKSNKDETVTIEVLDADLVSSIIIGLSHYCDSWTHPNYARSVEKARELRDKLDAWMMEGMD